MRDRFGLHDLRRLDLLRSQNAGSDLEKSSSAPQQPFAFLPGIWSNFGVILNYTGTDSEVDYLNADGTVAIRTDLAGYSKSSYNATLYYRKRN